MLSITKAIEINHHASNIFDALTQAPKILEYFPLKSATIAGTVGGEVVLEGEGFIDYGVILAFKRPYLFSYGYWSTNHGTENLLENRMKITYRLQSQGDSTLVEVVHDNLLTLERERIMLGVWDYLLGNLKNYCEQHNNP